MTLVLVVHQFPLDRLAGSCDLVLVVDDGPAQLTRISLARAIRPGLDQEVSTSLHWYPVVDCLGLMRQQQRLEILWNRRGRGGPRTTRLPFSSASSVCGTANKQESRRPCSVEATGFGGGGNVATAFRVK